eukprot:scaffold296312_cov27-Tisochrysis_lutea.AAC.1
MGGTHHLAGRQGREKRERMAAPREARGIGETLGEEASERARKLRCGRASERASKQAQKAARMVGRE